MDNLDQTYPEHEDGNRPPRMWEAFAAMMPGATAPEPEPEPTPEPELERVAEVVQLPGTRPARPDRGTRDNRRPVHPAPGSPDRWDQVPRHVTRNRNLPMGARVLFAELQAQVGEAKPALRSLGSCRVTVGQLAGNLGANRDSVRLWLDDLERAHVITSRPAATQLDGLTVHVLWTSRGRR